MLLIDVNALIEESESGGWKENQNEKNYGKLRWDLCYGKLLRNILRQRTKK